MMTKSMTKKPWDPIVINFFLVLSFFLISYILPLGARDLIIPDETRYGEIPREMIAKGNWVVPHLNGLRYFEKPPLGYWVHAVSIMIFGENNFAVRFPSAIAVGFSALLIFLLVDRMARKKTNGDRVSAILAALIFLSCFEVFAVGNMAVLDNLFALFLTATIVTFYFASEAHPGSKKEKYLLLLSGVWCGLSFLTKGFLAFAIPVLTLAPYLIWQRRYKDLFRMSWIPILAALFVAFPWGILIQLRESDFWHFFFWNEHIRRFMADTAQHKETFWFFFLTAPILFLPWSFMIPAAVKGVMARFNTQGAQGRLIKLSITWLIFPFLFFSFSNGKLLTYILPCFPPFAILMAIGLLPTEQKTLQNKFFQGGIIVCTTFLGLLLLACFYIQLFGSDHVRPYHQAWKMVMAANGLLFFIFGCIWAFKKAIGKQKILLIGLAPLFMFFIIHFIIPDSIIEKNAPGKFFKQYKQIIGNDDIIISDENAIRAVCWYLQRDDVYLLGGPGELTYGLRYEDSRNRWIDMQSVFNLINQNRGKVVMIAKAKNMVRWWHQNQFPESIFQKQSGPNGYVLCKY